MVERKQKNVIECTEVYSSLSKSIDGVDHRGHVERRIGNTQHEIK